MLFNQVQFLVFFIVVTLAYFSLSWRGRWILLLTASCYFYMVFKPVFILILFATIVIDYFAGIWIEQAKDARRKRLLLTLSLISNIGILAFFKYFDFFTDSVNDLFSAIGYNRAIPHLSLLVPHAISEWIINGSGQIILPIGLSFHTFQAMSYTIEVYRGHQKAERHFGIYSLYVMFYPQLVAGPIERPQNMLYQFHSYFKYDFEQVKSGLMQMAFGLFKKVVIADRLTVVVDAVYKDAPEQNGLTLAVAAVFYSFQIYCDFSGYSDIAIGSARVMGFKLMDNFNTPYQAKSIPEFWARWHISLSTWFKDYLYIPLGGNRKGEVRRQINQMTVMLVSGLWHGASWNFVVWGAIHGVLSIMDGWKVKLLKKWNVRLPTSWWWKIVSVLFTFSLVTLAWIFFRNVKQPISRALMIIDKIMHLSLSDKIVSPLNVTEMWFCVVLIGFLLLKEKYYLHIPTRNTPLFIALFVFTGFLCYFFGVFNSSQFIYFQF